MHFPYPHSPCAHVGVFPITLLHWGRGDRLWQQQPTAHRPCLICTFLKCVCVGVCWYIPEGGGSIIIAGSNSTPESRWVMPLTPLSCLHLFLLIQWVNMPTQSAISPLLIFIPKAGRSQGSLSGKTFWASRLSHRSNTYFITPVWLWNNKTHAHWYVLVFFWTRLSPRRKMMDSGQIDFYQHDTVCSNTCRSTKFDVLLNSTRLPPGSLVQPSPSSLALDPLGGQMPPLTGRSQPALKLLRLSLPHVLRL